MIGFGGDLDAARGDTLARPRPARAAVVLSIPRRLRPGKRGLGLLVFLAVLAVAAYGTGFTYEPLTSGPPGLPPAEAEGAVKSLPRLRSQHKTLETSLRQKAPRGTYVIIDQTLNRLYLKKDEETLLEAKCSAGSGMILEEGGGKQRRWIFDTPRGRFKVLQRISDPIWKKPDWAFVEEGKPIPKNPEERFESGTLGEYALHFGNGYMIHGTLYERLLGRSVTHGCIRLGKEDLRKVWAEAQIGTPIYIF